MKNIDFKNKLVILGVCALLFFSGVAFPFILAASPENRDLETIEGEDVFPAEEHSPRSAAEHQHEPDPVVVQEEHIDIKAITAEMAIEIAREYFGDFGESQTEFEPTGEARGTSIHYIVTKYMDSSTSGNDPSWFVFTEIQHRGEQHYYLNEHFNSLEELITEMQAVLGDNDDWIIDTNNDGLTVAIRIYHNIEYVVLEINAFNGMLVSYSVIADDVINFDEISSWDEIRELFYINIEHMNPEPAPIPGANPIPTPEPYPGAK